MPAVPELTQVEKDKLTINPDFDFRAIASRPFAELTPNEVAMFKWSGVYHQLQPDFFMIRLVTPGGLMTTRQFRRAIELAEAYAQGELCITTRQTLQYHWVRQMDIYKVIEGMAAVGITTKNGCGDVTRNVVGCSLLGVCPHEVGELARSLILQLAGDPEIRDRQRNLPRKHKISVAGCDRACAQTLMNCQGWVPVARPQAAGGFEFGWQFHAGGGLGARPFLAKRIFSWVPPELALPVAQATIEAFRRHGDRRQRAFARLKVVVDRLGPAAFGQLLLDLLREREVAGIEQIELADQPQPSIGEMFLDGQESIPQRQPGLSTVRIMVPRSELSATMARQCADWADQFGNGEVMFTNRQNLEIRHVPTPRVDELLAAIHAAGLQTAGHERLPDVVACVGTTVCRMAAADTPAAFHQIVDAFNNDREYWERIGPLRINLTGCPNNCAHAWIADLGLRGKRVRQAGGGSSEAFDLYIGGKLSGAGRIAEPLGEMPAAEVAAALRQLLDYYLAKRQAASERFIDFCQRLGTAAIRQGLGWNQTPAELA